MQEITLTEILGKGQVWAGQLTPKSSGKPTGFNALDACLAQRGWPAHGLCEIHAPQWGVGELQLLLPSLAKETERLIVWLNPPHLPTAQSLKNAGVSVQRCLLLKNLAPQDELWALERCLASGSVAQALCWPSKPPRTTALKRLQQAAQQGRALAHLLHSWPEVSLGASTHVRVTLNEQSPESTGISVTRQRGGPASPKMLLDLRSHIGYRPKAPKPANYYPPQGSSHAAVMRNTQQIQLAL